MGGCTITKIGKSVYELLPIMKEQIIAAARIGLWVDSSLIIIDPWKSVVRIFKVEHERLRDEVKFHEVEEGAAFHAGVAGRYGPHPKPGEMVATVHVHS